MLIFFTAALCNLRFDHYFGVFGTIAGNKLHVFNHDDQNLILKNTLPFDYFQGKPPIIRQIHFATPCENAHFEDFFTTVEPNIVKPHFFWSSIWSATKIRP